MAPRSARERRERRGQGAPTDYRGCITCFFMCTSDYMIGYIWIIYIYVYNMSPYLYMDIYIYIYFYGYIWISFWHDTFLLLPDHLELGFKLKVRNWRDMLISRFSAVGWASRVWHCISHYHPTLESRLAMWDVSDMTTSFTWSDMKLLRVIKVY